MNNEIKFYIRTLIVLIGIALITYVTVVNIVKSRKFDLFIINLISTKLERLANRDLTKEEHDFAVKNLKKIYLKFKPIFDEIK